MKIFRKIILVFFVAIFVVSPAVDSAAAAEEKKKALILFDDEGKPGINFGVENAMEISNLLGHFAVVREVRSILLYKPGDAEKFDMIFYTGFLASQKFNVPDVFLRDLTQTNKKVCWINSQIDQMDRKYGLGRFGFKITGFDRLSGFDRVFYRGRTVDKGSPDTFLVQVTDPKICTVVAVVRNARGQETPYIVHGNNFWYIADSPFSYSSSSDRYLVFADILHEITGEKHQEKHTAVLRIEDVNPAQEDLVPNMKKIIDYLYDENVPFVISLIPIYKNPQTHREIYLSDSPRMVDIIKYACRHGGSIAMHGVTHQYHGESADDYEFWDSLANPPYGSPIRDDSESRISEKIKLGFNQMLACGIYPVLWETPHYMASSLDYSIFAKYFNTVIERRSVADYVGSDQILPYLIHDDMYGQQVIPENLGYIPLADTDEEMLGSADELIRNAAAHLAVRDSFVGVFYHPIIGVDVLRKLVAGIKNLGYEFVDVRDFNIQVTAPNTVIMTGQGHLDTTIAEQFTQELFINSRGRVSWEKISKDRQDGDFKKDVQCPVRGMYVLNKLYQKPAVWPVRLLQELNKKLISFVALMKGRSAEKVTEPANVVIAWDPAADEEENNNQLSYFHTLDALGINVSRVNLKELFAASVGRSSVIIVPAGTANKLEPKQIDYLVQAVESGQISLVTEERTPLTERMGVPFTGRDLEVQVIDDEQEPELDIEWEKKVSAVQINPDKCQQIFCRDRNSRSPLIAGIAAGSGKMLFLAALLDPETPYGYKRFPYFFLALKNYLCVRPVAKRRDVEVYFDPGFRQDISIETLAKMWAANGVRAVHAGAWHFYARYTYDYERLIKVCHQNGIVVYAWFELPHVSEKFWNTYPQWREIAGNLKVAHDPKYSWRYLMAMTIPECRAKVLSEVRDFVNKYDWDGVNIAELYFDPLTGPETPEMFTPMNDYFRHNFKKKYGYDPSLIFNNKSDYYWKTNAAAWRQLADYRIYWVTRLHEAVLSTLDEIHKEKVYLDVVMTIIDDLKDPQLRDYIGMDVGELLSLQKKYDFTLQVEDPAPMWVTGPERYEEIGKEYSRLVAPSRLMLDINIIPRKYVLGERTFPTDTQTGQEVMQLLYHAAKTVSRVCFYAESTLNQTDFGFLQYVMAQGADVDKQGAVWHIKSPHPVEIEVGRAYERIELDGKPWQLCNEGVVTVPAGEHELKQVKVPFNYMDTSELDVRVTKISGDILNISKLHRGILIEYESVSRCFITVNKKPYDFYLDGVRSAIPLIKCDEGFTLIAPPGKHKLTVFAQGTSLYWVEFVSLFSSSLIVAFGLTTSVLLILLYTVIRIRKTIRKRRKNKEGRKK